MVTFLKIEIGGTMRILDVVIGCSIVAMVSVISVSFALEETVKDNEIRQEIQEELRDEIYPDEIIEEREDGTIVFMYEGRLYSI